MMVDVKIKVVNKSKIGVTFKYLGVESFMGKFKDEATWEEFEDMFEKTDEKFIFRVKDKHLKVVKEKNDFFMKLMPWMLSLRVSGSKDLTGLIRLGSAQGEYQEKFGGSPIDFITEYKQFEKAIFETMMKDGIGVGNVHRKAHGWDEKPEYDYKKNKANKEATLEYDGGCSIGDMLKAKNGDK